MAAPVVLPIGIVPEILVNSRVLRPQKQTPAFQLVSSATLAVQPLTVPLQIRVVHTRIIRRLKCVVREALLTRHPRRSPVIVMQTIKIAPRVRAPATFAIQSATAQEVVTLQQARIIKKARQSMLLLVIR